MKRHHPAEFFCGLLNAQPMGFYSPRTLVNEARREGISILPPDIHRSGKGFTVEKDGSAIRVGLAYAKGLSRKAVDSVFEERERGAFGMVQDLYRRTAVARDALESLVKGGFLDALSPRGDIDGRGALLSEARAWPKKPSGRRVRGQDELPLPHPARPKRREGFHEIRRPSFLPISAEQGDKMEWEALSLNVSGHPLSPYREALRRLGVFVLDQQRLRACSLVRGVAARPCYGHNNGGRRKERGGSECRKGFFRRLLGG